jgi:hypothetical protein
MRMQITMERTGGNQCRTAELLRVHRNTIWRELQALKVERDPPIGYIEAESAAEDTARYHREIARKVQNFANDRR